MLLVFITFINDCMYLLKLLKSLNLIPIYKKKIPNSEFNLHTYYILNKQINESNRKISVNR